LIEEMSMRWLFCLASIVAGLLAPMARAHEFWMWASNFAPHQTTGVRLQLYVGSQFDGVRAGFTTAHAAAMRHYSRTQVTDLLGRLPDEPPLPDFPLTIVEPGTHVIAYDSQPAFIELSADKFHAYLREEGLESVIQQREADGTATRPGRERFRRHIKCIVQAGEKFDATFATRADQRFEIVPLENPTAKTAGAAIQFSLLFDGAPLAGTLVKAWHKHDGQTVTIRARSGNDGHVSFSLPYSGGWMISAVHMIPASDTSAADWDSFWGNLSFALPSAAAH
jgi:uncharacterized GH25 family protein